MLKTRQIMLTNGNWQMFNTTSSLL